MGHVLVFFLGLAVILLFARSAQHSGDAVDKPKEQSDDDKWKHCGGMSCACPGRLEAEVSRGSTEANHMSSLPPDPPLDDLTPLLLG